MTRQDLFEIYLTDPELIEKWHIRAGEGIEVCTNDTWSVIKNHEFYLFDFGYFSIDRDLDIVPRLGGFFIKPEFRTPDGKSRFIKELLTRMPRVFLSGLHNKNIRGIRFLKSVPGAEIVTTTNDYTYFVFRQENI